MTGYPVFGLDTEFHIFASVRNTGGITPCVPRRNESRGPASRGSVPLTQTHPPHSLRGRIPVPRSRRCRWGRFRRCPHRTRVPETGAGISDNSRCIGSCRSPSAAPARERDLSLTCILNIGLETQISPQKKRGLFLVGVFRMDGRTKRASRRSLSCRLQEV